MSVITCLAFTCLMLQTVAKRIHEPECSRFDYDEKVLAKLVRMEYKMELLEERLNDADAAMASKMAALEVSGEKREAFLSEKIAQEATDRSTEMERLKAEVETLKVAVEGSKSHSPIAFMAQISSDVVNPNQGDVLKFDDVITNVGGAYDASQGTFTAPLNGVYNFNLVASAKSQPSNHALHLHIMKDSVQAAYIFLDNNVHYWFRRSTDITLELATGNRIWVKVGHAYGQNKLGGCCFHNHFSGFLIDTM